MPWSKCTVYYFFVCAGSNTLSPEEAICQHDDHAISYLPAHSYVFIALSASWLAIEDNALLSKVTINSSLSLPSPADNRDLYPASSFHTSGHPLTLHIGYLLAMPLPSGLYRLWCPSCPRRAAVSVALEMSPHAATAGNKHAMARPVMRRDAAAVWVWSFCSALFLVYDNRSSTLRRGFSDQHPRITPL